MIEICYTICPKSVSQKQLNQVLEALPNTIVEEARQFLDIRRKLRFVTGRLMLQKMIPHEFESVCRTKMGKPYLSGQYQFNICHSESLVVCAVSNSQRLGIDSEKVKEVDIKDYESVLNEDDYYTISHSNDKMRTFCRIWTQKESLTKADGRGVFIDMKDVFLDNMQGYIKGESVKWRFVSFTLIEDYEISLCHEWGKEDVKLRKLDQVW